MNLTSFHLDPIVFRDYQVADVHKYFISGELLPLGNSHIIILLYNQVLKLVIFQLPLIHLREQFLLM